MKTHGQTQRGSFRTPCRLGWLLLLPALALSLPAQTGPELSIQDTGGGNAVISYQDPGEDYVLLSSATLDGPWIPCLEPIARGPSLCQITVCSTNDRRYFRLARGQRFEDDFEDGDLEGWTISYYYPQWEDYVTVEVTDGQLRVHGYWPGQGLGRHVFFYRTNLMMADFAMSIDILGWDEQEGDQPDVILMARLDPATFDPPIADLYSGGVGMQYLGSLDQSVLWLAENSASGWQLIGDWSLFGKTDPTKDYRLVFYGVGSDITVQLFNLTDGSFVHQYHASDTTLTNGCVGLWVSEPGSNGTVDFTLDNFVAIGTTP